MRAAGRTDERAGWAAAVEEVRLAVNQIHKVSRERAIELLSRRKR